MHAISLEQVAKISNVYPTRRLNYFLKPNILYQMDKCKGDPDDNYDPEWLKVCDGKLSRCALYRQGAASSAVFSVIATDTIRKNTAVCAYMGTLREKSVVFFLPWFCSLILR